MPTSRDERNRRRVPLGPLSLRRPIDPLAAIVDDAIEEGHIEHNAACTERRRREAMATVEGVA
jgi:hypothetical protein